MNANIPVLALSLVGVLLAVAGAFIQQSMFMVLIGIVIILFAFVLQEMARRRA